MSITFNGVDLGDYGLVTPKMSGVHDLADVAVEQVFIPGYALPAERQLRDALVTMRFSCVVAGDSHSDLIDKLSVLKALVSPRLGWKYLTVSSLSDLRTLARFNGFPINIEALPYDTDVVTFELTSQRAPWWEEVTAQTTTISGTTGQVINDGQLPCWPIYTCTVTATLSSGLYFEVNGERFTYSGALASGDILAVETEMPAVSKNGTDAMASITEDCMFPGLGVGVSTISKSSSDFVLNVSYRRRYE